MPPLLERSEAQAYAEALEEIALADRLGFHGVWLREGLGVLAGPFKPWPMIAADIRRYRAAWRRTEAPRVAMTVGMLCLRDGARARALAAPALRWSYGELLRVTAPVLERLVPSYEYFRELGRFRRLFKLGARMRVLELAGLVIVGTPAHCIERIGRLRAAGVTHLLCSIGAGAVPTEVVRESLECIGMHCHGRAAATSRLALNRGRSRPVLRRCDPAVPQSRRRSIAEKLPPVT